MKVDWHAVIQRLLAAGLTLNRIAYLLGRSPSTVHGWTSGTEPKYSDGEALLKLSGNRIDTSAG